MSFLKSQLFIFYSLLNWSCFNFLNLLQQASNLGTKRFPFNLLWGFLRTLCNSCQQCHFLQSVLQNSPVIGSDSEKNSRYPRDRKGKKKKVSTWPGWGRMSYNLLIICRSFDSFDAITVAILLLWCFKFQGSWSGSEPRGASTEHCSSLPFQ